jgi:hypothetical protein
MHKALSVYNKYITHENGTSLQNKEGEMEHLSLHLKQQKIQWRRDKVQELASKGHSQREISQILQVPADFKDKYAESKHYFHYVYHLA